jgi:hypothetical protein
MQQRKHLLVPRNHRLEDRTPKVVEFVVVHTKAAPDIDDDLLALVRLQERGVIAQLADKQRFLHLFRRSVGLVDQGLRETPRTRLQ